jgi:serine/threonine-protein kinase
MFARHGLVVMTPVLGAALVIEAALHEHEPFRQILASHAWLYFGTAAGLIAFRRHRTSWLEALDRRLFRERYDAVRLLREVAAQIRISEDLESAAEYAASQIDAALHPEWVAVCSCQSPEGRVTVLAGRGRRQTWPQPWKLIEQLQEHAGPLEISRRSAPSLPRIGPYELAWLNHAGVRLIAPAAVNDCGSVIFVLGAKRSGEPYSGEDKNLVQAVAESLGHLAATRIDTTAAEALNRPQTAWDQRVWSLADAVARGSHVDWTKESTEIVADERREVLLELQALERLMQVHGAAVDPAASGATASEGVRRWGSFELREQIGAGRFGSVYRAWDPNLERAVAIKLLDVAGVDRAAYLREARHLARVRHPNVVHVYGAAEFDEIPGFWMEFIDGRTLAQLFQERGPFGIEELGVVGGVLCRALAAVHRAGLIHQDVKAQNVMREPDGRLVLMDLGAGSGIGHDRRPQSGTPRYMAPELFDGGTASVRSDIYSLGVLLFLLATGEFPTTGRSYAEIAEQHRERRAHAMRGLRPDFPSGFLDAIDRVLRPDPLERFASAEEFSASILSEVS